LKDLRAQAAGIMAKRDPGAPCDAKTIDTNMAGREAGARHTGPFVRLIDSTPGADDQVAAALLHTASNLPLDECRKLAQGLGLEEKKSLIKTALRQMKAYDAAPREFEQVNLLFELTISATCFAQVKRHRMASLTVQDYDPSLGVTIPPAVLATGMEKPFREICAKTEDTWETIRRTAPETAAYVLTNAHRRRAALRVNARELYHISRVRADRHAQWDIRETASQMVAEGRKAMPLTLMLAAGKDGFEELFARVCNQEGG